MMVTTVTGECLCHGSVVTISYGCPARPRPYWTSADPFGAGPRVKVVFGIQVGTERSAHDVPLAWPKGVERLTDQPTIINRSS